MKNNLFILLIIMFFGFFSFSQNPNITIDIIQKYSNKPWNRCGISYNPNITIEFIEKNKDHEKQLRSYSSALKKANYRVKGAFLVYVSNKIEVLKIDD